MENSDAQYSDSEKWATFSCSSLHFVGKFTEIRFNLRRHAEMHSEGKMLA